MGVLCNRLKSLEYIDLAEKLLAVLSRLCEQQPFQALTRGAVGAMLPLLDFFPSDVQRRAIRASAKALSAAAATLQKLSFPKSGRTGRDAQDPPTDSATPEVLTFADADTEFASRNFSSTQTNSRRLDPSNAGGVSSTEGTAQASAEEELARHGRLVDQLAKQKVLIEAQTEEYFTLLAPALPVLTSLLSSGDEVVVQASCQGWKSVVSIFAALHAAAGGTAAGVKFLEAVASEAREEVHGANRGCSLPSSTKRPYRNHHQLVQCIRESRRCWKEQKVNFASSSLSAVVPDLLSALIQLISRVCLEGGTSGGSLHFSWSQHHLLQDAFFILAVLSAYSDDVTVSLLERLQEEEMTDPPSRVDWAVLIGRLVRRVLLRKGGFAAGVCAYS